MSNTRLLSELLQALPLSSDMIGKKVLVSDSSGILQLASNSTVSPLETGGSINNHFANVLKATGVYVVALYSESNRFICCSAIVFMVKFDAVNNQSPVVPIGGVGNLTIASCNAFGTIVARMTDNSELPTDLVLRYIRIPVDY